MNPYGVVFEEGIVRDLCNCGFSGRKIHVGIHCKIGRAFYKFQDTTSMLARQIFSCDIASALAGLFLVVKTAMSVYAYFVALSFRLMIGTIA